MATGAPAAARESVRARPDPLRRRALARALSLVPLAVAPGCGFRLRRSASLPFATLYSGFPPGSAIGTEFARLVRLTEGTRLVDKPQDAEVILDILNDSREREIVAFSTTGRPAQYQLRQRLDFRVRDAKGNVVVPDSTLLLRRDITASDTQIVSKQQEEALLYREMQTDIVQQLMRRLAAIRRSG